MFNAALQTLSRMAGVAVPAAGLPPAMSQYIYEDLMAWANDARIVAAIREQNRLTAALTEAALFEQAALWQEEGEDAKALLATPLSGFLRQAVMQSQGQMRRALVLDAQGLAVAASAAPAQIWQGNRAHFLQSFGKGAGAVFLDGLGETQASPQVSLSVSDPANGAALGVLRVSLRRAVFLRAGRRP